MDTSTTLYHLMLSYSPLPLPQKKHPTEATEKFTWWVQTHSCIHKCNKNMALVILFIFFIDVCLFSCDENMVGSTLLQINTVAAFFSIQQLMTQPFNYCLIKIRSQQLVLCEGPCLCVTCFD